MEANAIYMDMVRQWAAVYEIAKFECQRLKREAYLFGDSGLLSKTKRTQGIGRIQFFAGDVVN